jgi:hypothetical protein
MLKVSMTAVETGLTRGLSIRHKTIYDYISGFTFDTIPTSTSGWYGAFSSDAINYKIEHLEAENKEPLAN